MYIHVTSVYNVLALMCAILYTMHALYFYQLYCPMHPRLIATYAYYIYSGSGVQQGIGRISAPRRAVRYTHLSMLYLSLVYLIIYMIYLIRAHILYVHISYIYIHLAYAYTAEDSANLCIWTSNMRRSRQSAGEVRCKKMVEWRALREVSVWSMLCQ